MELHLKQWRDQQQESEQPGSAKIPKLFLEPHQQQQLILQPSGSSAIPFFVPEPTSKVSSMSAFPDSNNQSFPRMGSCFSLAQWQELELQARIYRYMLAGAAIPSELLHPIKKGLLHTTTYFRHPLQHYPHYQPSLLQSGYWGRAPMDPEPGRCRRTDGKKWRCSRDVAAGHKYCERHMHRWRNRSRKHVEVPTPTSATASIPILCDGSGGLPTASRALKPTNSINTSSPLAEMANGTGFGLTGPSPSIDLLHFNQSSSVLSKNTENKGLFEHYNEADNRNDGHILRHFFDDWPRSIQETNNAETNITTTNSATFLSISMPGNLSSSDISLNLYTGNGEEMGSWKVEREEPQLNWETGWTANQVASMGGPIAEALRYSISNSSPTSVLHQFARASAAETSYVST